MDRLTLYHPRWRGRLSQRIADDVWRVWDNIAAAGAEDGRKGLSFSLNTMAVQKFYTNIQPRSPKAPPINIEWGFGRAHHYLVNLTAPWGRGWVFEETFLVLRTLHFGEEQIFWDCEELQACETYPEDYRAWTIGRVIGQAIEIFRGNVIFQVETMPGLILLKATLSVN